MASWTRANCVATCVKPNNLKALCGIILHKDSSGLSKSNLITYIFVFRPHRMHRCGLLLQMFDIAWSVCACLLDTIVSPVETAEPIEMTFRVWSLEGLSNHVLDEVQIPHGSGQILGDIWPTEKHWVGNAA